MKPQNKHNPEALSYKLVTGDDWQLSYKATHPLAVHDDDKSEYMISLIDSTGKLTREQARDYISANWPSEEVE